MLAPIKPRPFDCIGGPDLLDALTGFITSYREAGHPPEAMQKAALEAYPNASGGDFAVSLLRANRRRDGR